jgi:hypothetical protein
MSVILIETGVFSNLAGKCVCSFDGCEGEAVDGFGSLILTVM